MSVHPRLPEPAESAPAQTDPAPAATRPSARGFVPLLRVTGLRRIVYVRLFSSFGDGAFQGALAVLVLFSPERATSAAEIAAGFAVLLLPYSIIGPFAGALLDRWSRRRVIFWANVIRSLLTLVVATQIFAGMPNGMLFVTALLITGVSRFVGSGLSASLPHTVARDSLVGANGLATTAGAIATAVGAGYALVFRAVLAGVPGREAIITATVSVFYLAAALVVLLFSAAALGPDETDEPAQPLKAVLAGFWGGLSHILRRPTVGLAVLVVMAVRFCFGLSTMVVLLLYQKYFTESQGLLRAGPAGIAEVLAAGAAGVFLGAVMTAPTVRRLGRTRWVMVLLTTTSVLAVVTASQFTLWSTLVAAFLVGFAYQSSKICMDTVVQQDSDDAHVGRVFALYDTANNVCYVGAFALGVVLLPPDGHGMGAIVLAGAVYLVTGLGYGFGMARIVRRRSGTPAPPRSGAPAARQRHGRSERQEPNTLRS